VQAYNAQIAVEPALVAALVKIVTGHQTMEIDTSRHPD
jgi:hypothetical protein